MFTGHRRLDDGLLQRMPVLVGRHGPVAVEAEEALEFVAGIVALPTPTASWIGAGGVAQEAGQPPGLRKLVTDPRRHHRVAARHRQPSQGVRQRPAVAGARFDDSTCLRDAGNVLKAFLDGIAPSRFRWSWRAAQGLEEQVEARMFRTGAQPVPCG